MWDEQVKSVQAKVSRSLGFRKHAKKFLPKHFLCRLYSGIVELHFRYCCSVSGNCAESRFVRLNKFQNHVAEIFINSSNDALAEVLMKEYE